MLANGFYPTNTNTNRNDFEWTHKTMVMPGTASVPVIEVRNPKAVLNKAKPRRVRRTRRYRSKN